MLKPLHDNVVLKKEEVENKTASGIILTSENKNKPSIGLVESIGEGVKDAGYKVGDRVEVKVSPDVSYYVKITRLDKTGESEDDKIKQF